MDDVLIDSMARKSRSMRNIIIVIIVGLISGCSSKPLIVHHAGKYTGLGKNEVYIVNHGWHTGFVIPAVAIHEKIPQLKERFGNTPYIEIGWGDMGFYQAKEITSGLTLRATFWPTESVIHSVAVPKKANEYYPNNEVEKICMSDEELSSFMSFIANSFYKDNSGNVVILKNGLYGDSQFYQGVGDYHLMNTCNKWTAKGLKSAGMDISPTFKLTSGSIMNYLSRVKNALTNAVEKGIPQCSSHSTPRY